MTFTRRHAEDPPETATELTLGRVAAALAARGYTTRSAADRVSGMWDGFAFGFALEGDTLVVTGAWGHELEDSHQPAMLLAVNDWNRDHLWPVCFTCPAPEGCVTIGTRFVVPAGAGLSNEQLIAHLDCALRAGVGFFQALGPPPSNEDVA